MTEIDRAMALARTVAPRLSTEKREACREKLPGLAEAVKICDDMLTDMRLDPATSSSEIGVVREMRALMQVCHDALAEMSGGAA